MLINFTLSNLWSFKDAQTLSMLASTTKKEDFNNINTFLGDDVSPKKILKSVLVFGANASGKSNLFKGLSFFRDVVTKSLASMESPILQNGMPFLLTNSEDKGNSELEIIFISNKKKYRYGISFADGVIMEEWLYWSSISRETLLFERKENHVEFNRRSFKEASSFVVNGEIQKTRPDVPFVSVLAGFDGERSSDVFEFFNKIKVITGANDNISMPETMSLIKSDPVFVDWLSKIIPSFQINEILINSVDIETSFPKLDHANEAMVSFFNSIKTITKNRKAESITVKKTFNDDNDSVEFPLSFESLGTVKMISLLGPIYNAIKNGSLIVIDEFDSRFHTLLSKFILSVYHYDNNTKSQIIAAVQDTNLMSTDIFRRDQIYFVNKNKLGESEIYSLIEYKDKVRGNDYSYSNDYLMGKFSAIPLFSKQSDIDCLMEDSNGQG